MLTIIFLNSSSMAMTSQCLQAQQNERQRQGDILGTVHNSIVRIDKSFEDLKGQLTQQVLYRDQTMAMLESAKQTIMYGPFLWQTALQGQH